MAIDFRLTSRQRALQLECREFAADVLANARAAEALPTPEERFCATKPVYEAMVAAGFLRKCIPASAGGDNAGLIDMAIMGRGALQRKCQRHLDDAGDCARSVADLARGHAGASWSPAQAILEEYWSAVGRLLLDRTGRQRQRRCSVAGRRRPHRR